MFEEKTDKELAELYDTYFDTIYGENSCYGVKDMLILLEIEHELTLRER